MLGGGGFYRGSSVLLSGVAGTGKTTIAGHFADAACRRGERCLFFVFEESAEQICRNARSVGLDLQQHVDSGLLRFEAARPSLYGLEMHLARMHRDLEQFDPAVVVIDPISAFRGPRSEVHADPAAHGGPAEEPGHHRPVHQPQERRFARGWDGSGPVLADGHLDQADGRRGGRRAQPHALRHQGARHEPLQPGARVPDHRHRDRADRRPMSARMAC